MILIKTYLILRVITKKNFSTTEGGREYVSKISKVIKETGEILEERIYSPNKRKPVFTWVGRPYFLN